MAWMDAYEMDALRHGLLEDLLSPAYASVFREYEQTTDADGWILGDDYRVYRSGEYTAYVYPDARGYLVSARDPRGRRTGLHHITDGEGAAKFCALELIEALRARVLDGASA